MESDSPVETSGKHKNVDEKNGFFVVDLSGKVGQSLRFRAAITFFFGITAPFVPEP
jgi:hypothetical protein